MGRVEKVESMEMSDLQARLLAQKQEKEMQAHYAQLLKERDLFVSSPVFTIIWDASSRGKLQQVSPNVSAILEYTAEEMTAAGFDYGALIHPEDREQVRLESQEYRSKGIYRYSQSYRMKTKSGAYRWFYDQTSCIRNAEGDIREYRGYLLDQTPLKEAQEALALSEKTHRELFNSSADALFVHEIETGRILDVNDTMLQMFGYRREELPDLNLAVLSGDEDQFTEEKAKELIMQCADEKNLTFEWVCRRKNGETFTTENILQCVTLDGVERILATVRDITDRKKAEEKLLELNAQLEMKNNELDTAVQQAQAANQQKSKFLATMNHEIRSPLNGLLGFAQLLENTPLDDEQLEYVSYMNKSARHLLSMVNNVLDLAKIEAGEMKLRQRPFHLPEEIDTALASLHPLAREKDIQLQITLDPRLPTLVKGDPRRLRQIILNLAGNAVKFTESGSVQIIAESVDTNEGIHTLCLQVQDTGPGMDQACMDRLFQPFYQDLHSEDHTPGGTGLGLSISHELVKLMGGRIKAESTLGKGTTFTVHLSLEEVNLPSANQSSVESRLN